MGVFRYILDKTLSGMITMGALELTYPGGLKKRYGQKLVKPVKAKITSNTWLRRIVFDPELALGEAYMQNGLRIKNDNIYDFMDTKESRLLLKGFYT